MNDWSALAKDAWRRGEAADDRREALRWLGRAHRLAPADDTITLSLALACLRAGDAAQGRELFDGLAARLDLAEAWLGLAASALRLGDVPAAVTAMQAVLSRHAAFAAGGVLAATVAQAAGLAGWCALDSAGRLHADGPAELVLDGRRIAPRWRSCCCRLPAGRSLAVERSGRPLLGSPIDRAAIDAVEGFVARDGDDVAGWAWRPRNPDRPPILQVNGKRVVPRRLLDSLGGGPPLARPRGIGIAAPGPGAVSVAGPDGRMLLGSPVQPPAAARPVAARAPPSCIPARRAVDVVVPVHGGLDITLACLHSVLPTLPAGSRMHVVDDAGPDPVLAAELDRMAAGGAIVLHRLAEGRGFPVAANVGLRACGERDVILLNSDTIVPPGWIARLADAVYSAAAVGTACPLSNEATILSYPDRAGGNPMPDPAALAELAWRANGGAVAEIPVAVGFCMFIRHDCLHAAGLLREDAFAQGYGEEVDWCLHARQGGWRHVVALGGFVAHRGGASFGGARHALRAHNAALLNRLHPGYDAQIAAWIAQDPLAPARRRMDAERWRAGGRAFAVALVSHGAGGGVDRVVRERVAAIRAAGGRAVLLRPEGEETLVGEADTPNLRFRLPGEWPALLRLLHEDRVGAVELHHTLGHAPALLTLAERLGVRQDVFVHDYASFCARISLVRAGRYCGEPSLAGCEACVTQHGSELAGPIAPAALVGRSTVMLGAASRVLAPSQDAATRIRRHFPAVSPLVAAPEDDAAIAPPPCRAAPVRHLCIVGAIGVEKGYEVLLACVGDAALRRLPLRFTVVGFTVDDARLLAAGPVFITGRYGPGEADALIRQQDADLAFIPSVWPETWCFALGEAWRAGLRAMVFDIGAPAERMRRTGWGHVLPLGLSPAAINDWVLSGAPAATRTPQHV